MTAPARASATALRRGLARVLGRVEHAGERVVIERNGVAVAALVPVADLETLELADAVRREAEAAEAALVTGTASVEVQL